eukprot:scaffold34093_cov59-Attheya_sp.AAC.4
MGNTWIGHYALYEQSPENDHNGGAAGPNNRLVRIGTYGGKHNSPTAATHPTHPTQPIIHTSTSALASSPYYAYVWIIGAIHEDKPSYKGFVWDVLISASLLRKTGSTADFWVYVRLSPESKLDTMPDEDLRLFHALGVKVKHLDKPKHESFSQLMYDKFYILNMTEYKRVMFLDADTIPLTNLDFYFHLSDPEYKDVPTLLKPFFIYATRAEPTNGGMFIAEPSAPIYEQYKEAVRQQHEKAKTLPYPHFDRKEGWGYSFLDNGDKWEAMNKSGKRWQWYGAHVDQGLMYYIAKFRSKEVSIAIGQRVQNWKGVEGQIKPEKESETVGMLEKYQPELLAYQYQCDLGKSYDFTWTCNPPYNSFAHFVGSHKPWQGKFSLESINNEPVSTSTRKAATMLWFKELIALNEEHGMGIDLEHWNDKHLPLMKESTLGYMPMYADQANVFDSVSNEGTFSSKK